MPVTWRRPGVRRLAARCAAALVACLLLVGCSVPSSTGPDSGPDDAGTTLKLVESNEPESLNPLVYLFGITSKFYDGLFAITADGSIAPRLATEPAVANDDATEWTVTVRDGVTFSDGSPLTAADVAATYQAIIDPAVGSPLASTFAVLDEVTADGRQVRFSLDQPYAGFEELLTVGIGKADQIGLPVSSASTNTKPVGSGPYVLSQWRRGESMTLKANPHYWQDPPAVSGLIISYVSDQNAIAQRLAGGDFDGAQLPPSLARTFADSDDLEVWTNPSADFRAVTLPRHGPGLDDARVRTALNLGVDRQAMVDGILFGFGDVASQPFSAAQGDYYAEGSSFDHDPDRARKLLDAAGWRQDGDQRTKDDQTLAFTLMYFPEDLLRRDLSLAFASDMKKIGVTVTVEAVGRDTFGPRIAKDAALFGGGDMPYDPDQHVAGLLDGASAEFDPDDPYRNPSGYQNARVDAALATGRATTDHAERVAAYRTVQDEYLKDPGMVVLVVLEHTYVARDLAPWTGLQHVVEPHEHGVAWGPWWNIQTWTRQ